MRAERDVLAAAARCRAGCRRGLPGDDRVAHLQAERLQDVALLAVRVAAAARCAPNGSGRTRSSPPWRDVQLVPLEVDDAVHPLVPAAAPPRVSSPRLLRPPDLCSGSTSGLCGSDRRDLVEHLDRLESPARRRRIVFANGHGSKPFSVRIARIAPFLTSLLLPRGFQDLLALAQPDVGLLPVRTPAGEPALALDLAVRDARSGRSDLRAEQLLDRRCLISILLAPRATWNTIVRPSSRSIVVFSVTSGRRMTSVSFMTVTPAFA